MWCWTSARNPQARLNGNKKPLEKAQVRVIGSIAQTRMALLEASLALNKAASRLECLTAFHLEANAVQGPKSLQPYGLRLRGLLAALLMPVKPARIHRHEQTCSLGLGGCTELAFPSRYCGTGPRHRGAHTDLGNISFWIDSGAKNGMK